MRTQTVEYKLYKFKELEDSAQEKALEQFYGINVDHDWWEFAYEGFKEDLNAMGLDCEGFYFGLDRDSYIEARGLHFTDAKKFVKSQIDEKVKDSFIEIADLFIEDRRQYRHTRQHISTYAKTRCEHTRLNKAIESLTERCNDKLYSILEGFLYTLQKEYDYLTSRESIIETIECNEYDFLENGKLF
jgi:hypothetical protein